MHDEHEIGNCSSHFRAELKSGFQSLIINEVLNLIEIVMHDEKTNPKS